MDRTGIEVRLEYSADEMAKGQKFVEWMHKSWKSVTGVGASPVEAYQRLDDQCDDILYVQGDCSEGHFVRTDATLANACVHQ